MLLQKTTAIVRGEAGDTTKKISAVTVRNQSLDALRGFAILMMILSGSIAFGDVLPAWMYHAQVPPPEHKFNPSISGITWVDLVFPFFLFSMGAAIPLAMHKRKTQEAGFLEVVWTAARRFILLTFFALFTYHMRAWVIEENPSGVSYVLSLFAFVLLCFQFYEYKAERFKVLFASVKVAAFAAGCVLLYLLPFHDGTGFKLDQVDIIILVLANMAFFGTIIWWLTRNNPVLRVGLLAFVMAIFLGGKEKGSWNEAVYYWSPLPWMYKFYYLKYLFIIIPGTITGEWLLQASKEKEESQNNPLLTTLLCFALVVCNVALLFSRMLVLNLGLTVALCLAIRYALKKTDKTNDLQNRFSQAGTYLLLLGLFFEAYEGGIRKDSSTYSYYFVTSGLAFFMLIGFYGLQRMKWGSGITGYLSLNGRNPMVAYVAGNLLLTPVLHLTGGIVLLEALNRNAWTGFFKGVLFTAIVSLVTILFTKRKWFWKT